MQFKREREREKTLEKADNELLHVTYTKQIKIRIDKWLIERKSSNRTDKWLIERKLSNRTGIGYHRIK